MKMPADEADSAKCATCLYWGLEPPRKGLCQRHAPIAGESELVAHWPHTNDWQWCGEYVAGAGQAVTHCVDCRFWSRWPNGLEPRDRDDRFEVWWAKAGHCLRFAPKPSLELGPRAFWPATNGADLCGDAAPALRVDSEDERQKRSLRR
jgi:hypothetical protein